MFIQPNSIIKIFHNVPLDNTYNHTLWFSTLNLQNQYFHANQNILKHTLTGQSYQRVAEPKMRVEVKADLLYDCNYIAFQNTGFGQKWFYAFINSVEYVNNETSEITFEIDVMQTYLFDVELKECFVEREHSITDNVGDNILSEPVEIGDIICYQQASTSLFDSYVAVVASAYNPDGQAGGYQGGLFSGVHYTPCLIDNEEQVQTTLEFLNTIVEANEQDAVVSIFLMPSSFYPTGSQVSVQVTKIAKNTKIHGDYIPRNKKLLTYPYNYLNIECGDNNASYRYEWFADNEDNTCEFAMYGTVSCNPQIALVPFGYNGVSIDHNNWNEKLVMKDFPQIAWSIDSFKAWLAQDATNVALSGMMNLISAPLGVGEVSAITSTAQQVVDAFNRPNQARGVSSGTIDCATRSKNFYFRQMQISLEYAKVIDNFFDKYGYAIRLLKIPNRSSRPHWNYTKTNGCVAVGKCPTDDLYKICSIYDNGITFWKNASEVGNYSLDNSPS